MKNHIILPAVLVIAAVVVGITTLAINYSRPVGSPAVVSDNSTLPEAVVSVLSISADQSAAAGQSGARIINWKTTNFPADAKVTINLIAKTQDNPDAYEFVTNIAKNTPNDGSESWTPGEDEAGDTLYIEVVCGDDLVMKNACKTGAAPLKAF